MYRVAAVSIGEQDDPADHVLPALFERVPRYLQALVDVRAALDLEGLNRLDEATGLKPVAILLGVFIWGKLPGFLGLVLAISLTYLGIA